MNLEAWASATHFDVRRDALLNPDNRIAGIASDKATLDARLKLRIERGAADAVFEPRLVEEAEHTTGPDAAVVHTNTERARVNQGFLRYKADASTWVVGRELFTWGPANLRSPSNPFYFDAGRTNPLAATPGVDLARMTVNLAPWKVTAAHVVSTSQLQPAVDLDHTSLLKIDHQGDSHLLSLVLSRPRGGTLFVGGFGQFTLGDDWLLYGEFSSSRQALSMQASESAGALFTASRPAPRQSAALVGASYTLAGGQVVAAEVLHDGSGYDRAGLRRYFDQARAAGSIAQVDPATGFGALGQALGQAPRLLGRDYLWLSCQSNPQDSGKFWRLSWTQNLTDGSGQAQVYAERTLVARWAGFVSLTVNSGGVDREYGALLRSSVVVGLKWFAL